MIVIVNKVFPVKCLLEFVRVNCNQVVKLRLRSPIGGLEIMLCATFKIVDDDRRYLNRLIELIRGNYKHDFGEEEQKVDFTVSGSRTTATRDRR